MLRIVSEVRAVLEPVIASMSALQKPETLRARLVKILNSGAGSLECRAVWPGMAYQACGSHMLYLAIWSTLRTWV